MTDDGQYIKETLGEAELLVQLAEECNELAQAALKYRRTITAANPTPVTKEEALDNLHEEIADVGYCLALAGLFENPFDECKRMEFKEKRCVARLKEANKQGP